MKKLGLFVAGALGIAYHNNEIYKREKETFDRINFCLNNKEKLSGVYLLQRQSFPNEFYNIVAWLSPYHQSLKIVNKDNVSRQVGISITDDDQLFYKKAEFVLHVGGRYDDINDLDFAIPIECWYDYKAKYGHYPNIDVEKLNKLTITRSEPNPDNLPIHQVIFGLPKRDLNGDFVFTTCRSEVMHMVRSAEIDK